MSIVRGRESGNLYLMDDRHDETVYTVVWQGCHNSSWDLGERYYYGRLSVEPVDDADVPDEVWARVAQLRLTGEIQ